MASCTDFNRSAGRPIIKATAIPISSSKKLVEPFNRLKYRANLFRRKNYSSQLNISSDSSNYRSSTGTDHIVPSHQSSITNNNNIGVILLKRSNSMVCPQIRLQSLINQNQNINNNNNNNNNLRNSICIELAGCSTDESSTDDYQLIKSSSSSLSSNRYWTKPISSTMNDIDKHKILSSIQPLAVIDEYKVNQDDKTDQDENVSSSLLPNDNNNSEQASVILPSTMNVIITEKDNEEKQQELISSSTIPISTISSSHSSSSSSSSTVILRDHAEAIRTRRQCHSSISLLQHQQRQQSLSSSFEEPFYDCKQQISPKKPNQNFDMSTVKISTCTMTGKSLNNLDDCLSSTSSEEKGVQTASNEPINITSCVKRAISSTSLSSSSTSNKTDSLEKKPKMPITTTDETTSTNDIDTLTHLTVQHQTELHYKWPHIHERLLGEQACIYWVNYLGSTAIKMSDDGTTAMPSQAIARLKLSTQYARVLPIIGLSISSRGVEFLKHTKDRNVICFHDIKSIHCACQDQDLRYFAYVTREQRLTNGMSHVNSHITTNSTLDNKQLSPPSPSLSLSSDYHHYCHVFVVKSETMSTEIMLTFGQVFDIAYRLHHRSKCNGKKSQDIHTPLSSVTNGERHHPQLEVIRLSTKSDITHNNNIIMSSSTHSPATSSSSSSMDDRKIFV
ncbi:unnamed protein product [Adineta steineri]|uniref:PID domain-containing protein n=1 Tax=Adineta steineri TaxID=433720 RepID=A0A814D494_9BILA|nr:unnamed protein product [Adineta steineri]CAF3944610.1 unnamed protein product [Adineta steineri]